MKIGFFTDSYKPYLSGVVKSIELFSSEIEKADHEVYIFAPDYPDAKNQDHIYRFMSLPVPTNRDFRVAIPLSNNVLQTAKKIGLDIVHTHSPFLMGRLGRYVARKLRIPLIFTYHTLYEEYAHYAPVGKELARKLAVKYSRDYCQSCDLVITPSKFVEGKLRSYRITTPLDTIPTGIDLKKYEKTKYLNIRDEYQLMDKDKILLFVGRLGLEKNVSFLIDSFKIITDSLSNVKLIIIGDGSERNRLEEQTNNLMLNNKVIFAGWQEPDRVIDFYKNSDLFVFPSLTETQGLVSLEAMAGGLPVVAANVAGSTSMIDDGLNGLLIKPDIYLFAQGVIDLLTHETRYNLFTKNAFKKAEELSIEKMAAKLLQSYEEISRVKANKFLA